MKNKTKKEKLIYDVDGTEGSKSGGNCPKFVLDEQMNIVTVVDREGRKARMTINEFNQIVNAVKNGEIKTIKR